MKPTAPSSPSSEDQWPSAGLAQAAPKSPRALTREIESFYERRLSAEVVLMPSGRSAIAFLLRRHGLNRRHLVFAPRWTSWCVWDAISHYSNPAVSFREPPDAAVVVHKWGRVERLKGGVPPLVIEDSVDSLFEDGSTLFPNGGSYEIVSLPKTIGSYCGGLIIMRDARLARAVRAELAAAAPAAAELGRHQSALKREAARGHRIVSRSYRTWTALEHVNTSLDARGLRNIAASLGHHERNAAVIRGRLEQLAGDRDFRRFMGDRAMSSRLGPVLPIPVEALGGKPPAGTLVLHANAAGSADRPRFVKVCALPLHFSVSEDRFRESCDRLRAPLRRR